MTFEQVYNHALNEVYKDELFSWLKGRSNATYYVIIWKNDEPVVEVVDRDKYYKQYCNVDNAKKVIATVTPDKTLFSSITVVCSSLSKCMSKLNQKLFNKAIERYNNSDVFAKRQDQIENLINTATSLDSRILTKYINSITEKTFENYIQSKAYQQHLLRLNNFEQDSKQKQLIKALTNAKAQVTYYKKKYEKSTASITSKLKKNIPTCTINNEEYIKAKELYDYLGGINASVAN